MLDAYTVRKAIPRIVIAAIGISVSIYLCVGLIDIVNIFGHGISELLVYPFTNNEEWKRVGVENNLSNGMGAAGIAFVLSLLGGGAIWAIASGAVIYLIPMMLAFVISGALVMLSILFTLALRQALLIFCVVTSPVAIALFILPGTEKYFKKWVDLFVTTLMVYPIVSVLFAMSTVMTTILLGTADLSPGAIGLTKILAAIVVAFAPLVMIPFAFKLAGGTIGTIMNAGQGKARTLSGAARKGAEGWVRNPDSLAGKFRHDRQSTMIDRGLTGRQVWARRPGGIDREGRLQSAKSLDQKVHGAKLAETQRYKARAQDSDVLNSLTMTEDQVATDRQTQHERISTARAILSDSTKSKQARDDANNTIANAQRILGAHADADQIGRNSSSAQSAFLSADRIKFTSNTHQQELELAQRLFGDGAAEAMNTHQAIAKGPAGRTDLSGSLYGQTYDLDRASSSQSMYSLMNNGRPEAVASLIDQHVARINSSTATSEEKERSAVFLHSVKASKGNGTPINNQRVNERLENIDEAINKHTQRVGQERYTASAPKTKVVRDQSGASRQVATTADEQMLWGQREAMRDLQSKSMASGYMNPGDKDAFYNPPDK